MATLAEPGGGMGILGILPFLLVIPFFFWMSTRQSKRQKEWQKMLSSIKNGDKVTTAGGIRGTIVSIKDDAIIMKVAPDGVKMEVAKSAIASVTTQESPSAS